jgi:L-iditol 2-dehydrogenase
LQLISSGAVPVADLITHRLGLGEALDAFDLVAAGTAIKVTIEP